MPSAGSTGTLSSMSKSTSTWQWRECCSLSGGAKRSSALGSKCPCMSKAIACQRSGMRSCGTKKRPNVMLAWETRAVASPVT